MTTRKYDQNTLVLGQWNAICDVCGFKFKSSDLRERWDGLMCCKEDWEVRHPMDYFRGTPDNQSTPWSRPESTDSGGTDYDGGIFPPTYSYTPDAPPDGTGFYADVGTIEKYIAVPFDSQTDVISDYNFNDASAWNNEVFGPGTVTGGELVFTNDLGIVAPTVATAATIGVEYNYEVIISSYTGGNGTITFGGSTLWTNTSGAGTFTGSFTATTVAALRITVGDPVTATWSASLVRITY